RQRACPSTTLDKRTDIQLSERPFSSWTRKVKQKPTLSLPGRAGYAYFIAADELRQLLKIDSSLALVQGVFTNPRCPPCGNIISTASANLLLMLAICSGA